MPKRRTMDTMIDVENLRGRSDVAISARRQAAEQIRKFADWMELGDFVTMSTWRNIATSFQVYHMEINVSDMAIREHLEEVVDAKAEG